MKYCKAQQAGIGDLAMADEVGAQRCDCVVDGEFVRPEMVVGVVEPGMEGSFGMHGVYRFPRKSGIGDQPNKGSLSEWASGPSTGGMMRKPSLGAAVIFMRRPEEG